jgi:SAM-dependent methyltransferase
MKDKNSDPDGYYRLKYEDKLLNLQKLLTADMPHSILDIGAGYGEFLEFFKEKGWTVYGIEPAEHCIKKGRGASCGIVQADFDALQKLKLPHASVITINTVLEHVPYPQKLLSYVRNHLMNDKTILHIEVPNDFSLLQECANQICSPRKYWVCPIGHLNYWSHATFTTFAERLGFRIESIESTFPLELLAMLGDDYISDPNKGRPMHLKRVNLERKFLAANAVELKLQLYKKFASIGIGREILVYMRKA